MDEKLVQILFMIVLTLYILVKDAFVPLIKKLNGTKHNPINLDRFYQSFLDFKKAQEWINKKFEKNIEKLDERLDSLERRK